VFDRFLKAVSTVILVALVLAMSGAGAASAAASNSSDMAAARTLFEANLDAIRHRDREAYLACYLKTPTLARTGPEGAVLGYDDFQKQAGEEWPDLFEGQDLRLVPVRPGLVYGTYRYRVRYGDKEQTGLSERFFLKTDDGWRIAVTTAFEAPPGTPPPPRALVGATLLDGAGGKPVKDAVVILRAGKIDCAGTRRECPVPEGIGVIDLAGLFVTPGLVDAHVHFSQTGWADGRPDALDVRDRHPYEEVQAGLRTHPENFFRSYLCSGVTAVFDVGGYPWTWSLRGRAESDTLAPHVAAAGPLLSTLDFWLNLPAERQFIFLSDEKTGREGVSYLASHGTDAIKVWFIPDESRDFDAMSLAVRAAGEEARRRKIPLIVHATGLREAKAALAAGARLLVHSVWDKPVDDEFLRLAKENGTIYCPTLTVLNGYERLFAAAVSGKAPTVDDPNGCVDAETLKRVGETPAAGAGKVDRATLEKRLSAGEARRKTMAENLLRVFKAGIPVAMGTDAGNPLTLHGPAVYAEMEAMQAAGMTPMEVLAVSTRGGAFAMRRQDEFGTVAKGKLADLLVVAADPTADIANLRKVRYVVRGGEVRTIGELRAAP
jgi:imidazolonepropionase-like amidohydrolase